MAVVWNALARSGGTEISADAFALLKAKKDEFGKEYQAATEELASEAPTEPMIIGKDHPEFSKTFTDGSGKERTFFELIILAQLAGGSGVGRIADTLDMAESLPEEQRGFLQFVAGNLAAEKYTGGLDFVIKMTSQRGLAYIQRHGRPDGNDFFDYWIQASVPDDEAAIFVTEERRWHHAAQLLGIESRVKRATDLLAML